MADIVNGVPSRNSPQARGQNRASQCLSFVEQGLGISRAVLQTDPQTNPGLAKLERGWGPAVRVRTGRWIRQAYINPVAYVG